jgi:phage recombination protein Bet
MNAIVALNSSNAGFSAAQVALIKNTVARDTNSDEFDLFVSVARNTRLDPLRKQIMAIVYSKDDAAKRKMSIVTGIDGLRAIASRSQRYRPDEEEPLFTYDEKLIGPANPLGLVKAVVKIYIADAQRDGGWRAVSGVAYWDEFAPIKDEVEGGFDWEDIPGQFWPDSNKPKKRKVPRVAGAAMIRQLDTSGQWGKMGRLMLAKCAEAQALRKAFPEDLSGLYEYSEMDQATAVLTPSEMVEATQVDERLLRIGGPGGILFQFWPNEPLESVGLGQIADKVMSAARDMGGTKQLDWFESVNQQSMREFWARAKTDALAVKTFLEERRIALAEAERSAAAEAQP